MGKEGGYEGVGKVGEKRGWGRRVGIVSCCECSW